MRKSLWCHSIANYHKVYPGLIASSVNLSAEVTSEIIPLSQLISNGRSRTYWFQSIIIIAVYGHHMKAHVLLFIKEIYVQKYYFPLHSTLFFSMLYSIYLLYLLLIPALPGVMGCGQKSFKLVWWWYHLLSTFLFKGHLPRVSRQSRRSLMIRVIMKCPRKLCTTSLLVIALRQRKTPENLS